MMSGVSLECCRGGSLRAQGHGNLGMSPFRATDWLRHPPKATSPEGPEANSITKTSRMHQ